MISFQSLMKEQNKLYYHIIKIQSRFRGGMTRQLFKLLKFNLELEKECKQLIRNSRKALRSDKKVSV